MADDTVARACRDIGDRYAFFASWTGVDAANIDDALKRQFTDVLQATLARAAGVEGGFWQPTWGSIAYMKGLDRSR